WIGMFQHVCSEAKRLGMQVNMNNDDGWSGSGGPWITPELSMQKVVWSETSLEGSMHFQQKLSQPPAFTNFYRDIALFAFPTPAGEMTSMADASPKITASSMEPDFEPQKLWDGDMRTAVTLPRPEGGKPQFIQLEFPQPYKARTLMMAMRGLGPHQMCHAGL